MASRLFGVEAEPVKIGRFTVLKRLRAGGMGVVYSAYDDQLDRKLAIKLLRGEESEQRRARLLREAQALARVSHPNVISVYEVGTFRTQVFVAMEFVRGRVLDMGVGAGRHALHLQAQGHDVVGIDNSPKAVEVCRLRGLEDARGCAATALARACSRRTTTRTIRARCSR